MLKLPFGLFTATGVILCFGLRIIAIRRGWHLPTARWAEEERRPPDAPHDRAGENRDGEVKEPNEN
jgi:hypothetical protein